MMFPGGACCRILSDMAGGPGIAVAWCGFRPAASRPRLPRTLYVQILRFAYGRPSTVGLRAFLAPDDPLDRLAPACAGHAAKRAT